MGKSYNDKIADELLKRHEKVDLYKNINHKASSLASYLTNKNEKQILIEDLRFSTIPKILLKLQELKTFYDNKKEYNDNSRILSKEINYCLDFLDNTENELSLQELRSFKISFKQIIDKYSIG